MKQYVAIPFPHMSGHGSGVPEGQMGREEDGAAAEVGVLVAMRVGRLAALRHGSIGSPGICLATRTNIGMQLRTVFADSLKLPHRISLPW